MTPAEFLIEHMGNGKSKQRISLAAKFSMMSIALILVTSVGISLFMVRLELNSYYQELLNHGMTLADTASQNCELGIYTEDRQALHGSGFAHAGRRSMTSPQYAFWSVTPV